MEEIKFLLMLNALVWFGVPLMLFGLVWHTNKIKKNSEILAKPMELEELRQAISAMAPGKPIFKDSKPSIRKSDMEI